MEGLINMDGNLEIRRRGEKYLPQACPFGVVKEDKGDGKQQRTACGDWCPQFGEPIVSKTAIPGKPDSVVIYICQGKVLNFNEFLREERTGELL